jgi:hypothetical protein
MTRIRVCGMVDSALAREIDLEFEAQKNLCRKLGEETPSYSDILQALLKMGLARDHV